MNPYTQLSFFNETMEAPAKKKSIKGLLFEPQMQFVDLFCGGGGTTTGIEHAQVFNKKVASVIACVNHDRNAIASHAANHPHALHFTEDIRTLDLTDMITHVQIQRSYYPKAKLCLWASLECTNFSKAKGGLPRDADSRTLAEHLFRYLEAMNFDMIFIENVEEFMSWGPLDENGKPISKKAGQDYIRWVESIKAMGYNFDYRILNAADYGAHTSRKRYFAIFARPGIPIRFPQPTHSKKGGNGLRKWNAVKEVLDFDDRGESIFGRKKSLSEKTLQRIHAGLIKFIAKGDTSFLKKYYSGRPMGKVTSTNDPAGTITTFGNQALVQAFFVKYLSNNAKTGINAGASVDNPAPTITTHGRLALLQATGFLSYYYGNGYNSSLNDPAGTITTKDRMNLIAPEFFIDKQYGSGKHNVQSIEVPAGTLTTNPKLGLVRVDKGWLMSTNFDNVGSSLENPSPTITANRKWHYLMFPQWGVNCSHSIDNPSPVLPARMDKMLPYLIEVDDQGEPYLPATVLFPAIPMKYHTIDRIVRFMAVYGLKNIRMRGLRIREMLKITGFDENYKLIGTQAEQKKFIGNAVPPAAAQALIETMSKTLLKLIQ